MKWASCRTQSVKGLEWTTTLKGRPSKSEITSKSMLSSTIKFPVLVNEKMIREGETITVYKERKTSEVKRKAAPITVTDVMAIKKQKA